MEKAFCQEAKIYENERYIEYLEERLESLKKVIKQMHKFELELFKDRDLEDEDIPLIIVTKDSLRLLQHARRLRKDSLGY